MFLVLPGVLSPAAAAIGSGPAIAIIVDDLGYRFREGYRAVSLPGKVACAVIPGSPHGHDMAVAAHTRGKEILLHLPMQSTDRNRPVGADGITLDTTRADLRSLLDRSLQDVPHAVGVNNHMGSLITRHPGHMTWLMEELRGRQLFFVDSVTTGSSVAYRMAIEQGVAATTRDVFIDHEGASEEEIRQQLWFAVGLARTAGQVLVIGHPYPATMSVLERELARLPDRGVRLVTVEELIALRGQQSIAQSAARRTPDGSNADEN